MWPSILCSIFLLSFLLIIPKVFQAAYKTNKAPNEILWLDHIKETRGLEKTGYET